LEEFKKLLNQINEKLLKAREKRIKPAKDTKILADWNGLIIAALAYAGRSFGRKEWINLAKKTADFLIKEFLTPDGRLYHRYADGEVKFWGTLEDYAYVIWGLLEVYEATLDSLYLRKAHLLAKQMIKHFWDSENGAFYLTPDFEKDIPIRKKEFYDGAIPSGNSVAAFIIIRLARLLGLDELEAYAQKTLENMAPHMWKAPVGYTFALLAVDLLINGSKELFIVPGKEAKYLDLLRQINKAFIPDLDYLLVEENLKKEYKFLQNLQAKDNQTTYYLCKNYSCLPPTNDEKKVLQLLEEQN
jgi:uncharacterized protein YyaL (SSP411 family)